MSTPNFSYENRCVLVPNEDYEWGNHPQLKPYRDARVEGGRSYPMSEVDSSAYPQEEPRYHAIVMTAGYYADACLDFVELDTYSIKDDLMSLWGYATIKEFVADVLELGIEGLTEYRIRKLMGKLGNEPYLDAHLDRACDAIDEWRREREEKTCNEIIDYLKAEFGYEELVCKAVFSNGEAIYERVA